MGVLFFKGDFSKEKWETSFAVKIRFFAYNRV